MGNTTTTDTSNATQAALLEPAKRRFDTRKNMISKLAAANTQLDDSDGYAVAAIMHLEAYVIYSSMTIAMTFDDGSTATFDGGAWGVGGGGYAGAGAGYMAFSASTLKSMGEVSFSVQFVGVTVGAIQVEFWQGGTFVGELTFAGGGVGIGAFGGTGTFS